MCFHAPRTLRARARRDDRVRLVNSNLAYYLSAGASESDPLGMRDIYIHTNS